MVVARGIDSGPMSYAISPSLMLPQHGTVHTLQNPLDRSRNLTVLGVQIEWVACLDLPSGNDSLRPPLAPVPWATAKLLELLVTWAQSRHQLGGDATALWSVVAPKRLPLDSHLFFVRPFPPLSPFFLLCKPRLAGIDVPVQ